jgi:hypothetical protein
MRFNNFLTILIISIVLMSACHSTKEIASTDNTLAESNITEEIASPEFEKIYKNETFNQQLKTLLGC